MPKKILVTQSSVPTIEEYKNEIKSIFNSKWLTNMGEKHSELEIKLKKYLKVENVQLLVNGHMALELIIQAFKLKYNWSNDSEIITTPFTFISTTHAIVRNGLKPVFADVNKNTCCIDPETIEKLITNKTVAILPVHVYGNICDVFGIEKLAKKYNLKVIYDAAHAFGVTVNNKGVGGFGDASIFSFHATKVFNTIEGGAVCFSDPSLNKTLYNLKNFGIRDEEYIEAIGSNAKMNEFCAAMGLCNLRHIKSSISKRRKVHERYVSNLSNIKEVKLLAEIAYKENSKLKYSLERNYAYFPIQFKTKEIRDNIYKLLATKLVMTRKYFYPLTNDAQCYANMMDFDSKETLQAKNVSDTVLAFPMYANLKLKEVDMICELLKGFLV